MNIVGYLLTLANLQSFNSGGQPTDVAFRIGPLENLALEMYSQYEFPLEGFKNGYQRQGNIGMFMSKNLQDYIYDKVGDPKSEGLILTLKYEKSVEDIEKDAERGRALFFHGKIPENVQNAVNAYTVNGQWPSYVEVNKY